MKTPDEIKKGLYVCPDELCHMCPYEPEGDCMSDCMSDALAYIQQLESRLVQAERERDAAVHDMENYAGYGAICKHFDNDCPHIVEGCPLWPSDCESYEWRGVCPENTKEEEK